MAGVAVHWVPPNLVPVLSALFVFLTRATEQGKWVRPFTGDNKTRKKCQALRSETIGQHFIRGTWVYMSNNIHDLRYPTRETKGRAITWQMRCPCTCST
ncbi:hypothetical protein BaRGS_00037799 [Batillaria attramentaria]|uniref:Secreted protein n=1 Tax=Batillaria attramentaria TaxID=370345 RepID=A0ABD0J7W0_9CAEN